MTTEAPVQTILMFSGCHNIKYHRLRNWNNKYVFFIIPEAAKSKIKLIQFLVRTLPSFTGDCFHTMSSHGQGKESKLSDISSCKTTTLILWPHTQDLFWTSLPVQAPISKLHHFGVRASIYELQGNTIQSIIQTPNGYATCKKINKHFLSFPKD